MKLILAVRHQQNGSSDDWARLQPLVALAIQYLKCLGQKNNISFRKPQGQPRLGLVYGKIGRLAPLDSIQCFQPAGDHSCNSFAKCHSPGCSSHRCPCQGMNLVPFEQQVHNQLWSCQMSDGRNSQAYSLCLEFPSRGARPG